MTKRDLLHKLQSVRNTERGIVPDADFVMRTRENLMIQVKNSIPLASGSVHVKSFSLKTFFSHRLFQIVRAPALAMFSVVVTIFGGSVLSVSASDRSLPGDFLYPIKIASEQTRLVLTSDKAEKLKLKAQFVDRRIEEIKAIATTEVPEKPVRLKQAAEVLKRDLNTVKLQLSEVKDEDTMAAAEVVKIVDQKSSEIAEQLKQVKDDAPEEVKESLAEAQIAAVHTGVTAVEVLIKASENPDTQWVVSEADVKDSLAKKVDSINETLTVSADKLRVINDSSMISASQMQATGTGVNPLLGMTSSTADQLNTASSTLQEARVLLSENKLTEISSKLLEAVKAASQAETATNQLVASSTQAVLDIPVDNSDVQGQSTTILNKTESTATSTNITPP